MPFFLRELRDRKNELLFHKRIEERLDVLLGLSFRYFKFITDALNHFSDGMTLRHVLPQNRTDRIEGVEGVKVSHTRADRDDNQFAFDLARHDLLIADETRIV